MFRLYMLGKLAIDGASGPLTGAAAQPKRLKLLAILDRAGERGVSREQLVDHLWADGDTERGRGSLNTAINALRQHLGADALVTAGEQVRLDPLRVTTDVRDFEAALRDGRCEDAVRLYGGPFLEGNERRETQRFEEWVRLERERLEAHFRRALKTLAGDAAQRRDDHTAAGWWDRLVTVDPVDSRAVVEFIHALLRVDDRARALRVAGIHEQLLQQHEIEPTPAWLDAAARLRDGRLVPPPVAGVAEEPRPAVTPAVVASPPQPVSPVPVELPPLVAAPGPEPARRRRVPHAVIAIAAAVVVLVFGLGIRHAAALFGGARDDADGVASGLDPRQIAVLYLEDVSPGAGLEDIAYGLTESLIEDLQQVPALRVIAPEGVKPYRGNAVPPDRIARQLHAGTIVSGTIDTVADTLRVTVRLLDGATARLLATHTLARPARNAAALQQTIAVDVAGVLRIRLGEEINLRDQQNGASNPEAWTLVLRAQRMQRDELSTNYSIDVADMAMAYGRADSLLAAAERLDPSWVVPPIERARLAEECAVRAWLAGGTWPPEGVVVRGTAGQRRTPDEWRHVGITHVERALALAPGDAAALEYRGRLRFGLWQWSRNGAPDSLLSDAITDLQAAVDAKPYSAGARTALSAAHQKAGNFGLARLASERALQTYLGPEAARVMSDLMFIALNEERYNDARHLCADGQRRFPGAPELAACELAVLGWSATRAQDAEHAWRLIDSVEAAEPVEITRIAGAQRRMFVAAILARARLADSAEAVLRAARSGGPATWLDDDEAYVRLHLGQPEQALALLRRYLAASPAERRVVAVSPWFKALRGNPEFGRLTSLR